MTINEMLEIKKEYGFSYEYISEKSGVPASTVQKVFCGTTTSPRRTTIEALRKVFEPLKSMKSAVTTTKKRELNGGSYMDESMADDLNINYVCEEPEEFIKNGTGALQPDDYKNKTIDDYYALPPDIRVELIDGVFYDMASPATTHQKISLFLAMTLQAFIDANNGSCQTYAAPTDVQLDCDEKTMVQPDVFVLCDESKDEEKCIFGAPDLVIEILSPSTRYHDTMRKLYKYRNAGVREYWIVMPRELKIRVYFFEKSDTPIEYSFMDKIPVGIWDGGCKVDFSRIYEKIKKNLYD
jgi:Uma2 family endonuclease